MVSTNNSDIWRDYITNPKIIYNTYTEDDYWSGWTKA